MVNISSLFKIDKLLDLEVKSYSFYEIGLKKLIALNSGKQLIYYYINSQLERIHKEYQWNFDVDPIVCMCFEPTGTWLLLVGDETIYLVPFLPHFDSKAEYDKKWSLDSKTIIKINYIHLPRCVVWWLTKELDNIIIIGAHNGIITFFSLESQSIVGETTINESIVNFQICIDDTLDLIVLLIKGEQKQWRLFLEHRSTNYNWLQAFNLPTPSVVKEKKDFMKLIKQLSTDKIQLFSQKKQNNEVEKSLPEYSLQPTEYLPKHRKPSEFWSLSVQYVNSRHFLTTFHTKNGSMYIETMDTEPPTRKLHVDLKEGVTYIQALWSTRIIYTFTDNVLEIHSASFANVTNTSTDNTKEHTLMCEKEFPGQFIGAHLFTPKAPLVSPPGWKEPTFICDLNLPRFNLEPCIVVTNEALCLVTTVGDPCEWIVSGIMKGGGGCVNAWSALAAPYNTLILSAADMLLSRNDVEPANYLYTLSHSPPDGWISRLGVFGRWNDIATYKLPENTSTLTDGALTMMILARLLSKVVQPDEIVYMDLKGQLSQTELEEICLFSATVGLWDMFLKFSLHRGLPHYVFNTFKHQLECNRSKLCRGALKTILKYKCLVTSLLVDDYEFFFKFLENNCEEFDLRLLKHLAVWLCPLSLEFRPVFRDLKQGLYSSYTARYQSLINTFAAIISEIDLREPSPGLNHFMNAEMDCFKEKFVPKSLVSCGLAHWAVVDKGYAKIMLADCEVKVEIVGRVMDISCGRHHTLLLTENGVYASGDNMYGQLGIGSRWTSTNEEVATASGSFYLVKRVWNAPIVSVAAGHYHSACIDSAGSLYTWGWGVHGQLGLGNINDLLIPHLVAKLQGHKVIQVGCGSCHTVVLTDVGDVWMFGSNMFGQLGTGNRYKHSTPVKLSALNDPVSMISVGYFHNLALTNKHELWTWGGSPQSIRVAASRVKDANTAQEEPHLQPTLVKLDNVRGRIFQISAGWHHSCILNNAGSIYSWGLNFDGQLGSGDRKLITTPTEINVQTDLMEDTNTEAQHKPASVHKNMSKSSSANIMEDIDKMSTRSMIACGGDFTVYIDDNREIYFTGNTHHQVSSTDNKNPGNFLIMTKKTKRVIRIPTNRLNNKFRYQYFDHIDNIFSSDKVVERETITPYKNPLLRVVNFKCAKWCDDVLYMLKSYLKDEMFIRNKNLAAKLCYFNKKYAQSLQLQLDNVKCDKKFDKNVYLLHSECKIMEANDFQSKMKIEERNVIIKSAIARRLKEIGLAILNEQSYPSYLMEIYSRISCCCKEIERDLKVSTITEDEKMDRKKLYAERASKIFEDAINMFPMSEQSWRSHISIAKEFYIENDLPITDLETILKNRINKNPHALSSAVMLNEDCAEYGETFTASFYLNLCNKLLDSWG